MPALRLPDLYRSEAFAEDVADLLPSRPLPRSTQARRPPARAAWLVVVPLALALVGVGLALVAPLA